MPHTTCLRRPRAAPFLRAAAVALAILAAPLIARPGFAAKAPSFPNVPDVPVPHGVSYGGYFKTHKLVRIVFGVSNDVSLKESLTNAAYTIKYLVPRHVRYRIQIVLYSGAVRAGDEFSNRYGGYAPLIRALHAHGVQFRVCHNSMKAVGLTADQLYGFMKVVPAGILQLTKKQMQGYAYINNG